MPFNDQQRQWVQSLFANAGTPPGPGQDDGQARPLLTGEGGAAGRDGLVNAQVNKIRGAAQDTPATPFKGDVFRSVPTDPRRIDGYADHSFSQGGRYNKAGQSALYTSPSVDDVRAEAKNYGSPADPTGIEGNTVVRSSFEGDMLDARSMKGVDPSALKEPWGLKGQERTLLSKVTGEDPYTMPRAVSDVAQSRNLQGVLAPANEGNTNIPLFPEKAPATGDGALHDNLEYKGQSEVRGGVLQPETVSPTIKPNLPDITPNRSNPAAIEADAGLHGRASGARYAALGAAVTTLGQDAIDGHFDTGDAKDLAVNTMEGAVIGKADTMLSEQLAKSLAGASAGEAEIAGVRTVAGAASAGLVGAVVGGGMAAWNDADKVKDGSMSAGDATADVAVSAGVGLGAGLAGAAAGAAVGSIIPVAGTAVGAVVGFGVGMVASLGATYLAEHSGVADEARKELGEALTENFEQPLQDVWHGASDASAAVGGAAKQAAGAVADTAGQAAEAVQEAGAAVADKAKAAMKEAGDAAAKAKKAVEDAGSAAAERAGEAAKAAEAAASAVAEKAGEAAKAAEGAASAVAEKAGEAAKAVEGAAAKAAGAVEDAAASVKNALGSLF